MEKRNIRGALAFAAVLTGALIAQYATAPNRAEAATGIHYVGERVYNITRTAYATIVAIDFNQSYVIRFETGPLSGQTGAGWRDPDLATLSGCSRDVCVGEATYNTVRSSFAQVVGIQYDGNYVLYFTTGPIAGQTGHGWSRGDLAVLRGCSIDLCVGQPAYNLPRQSYVTIVGIQSDGRYVLRFDTGPLAGQYGHNWTRGDLAIGPVQPMWTCSLFTQIRQYMGRGQSQGQATAAARNECLKFETSFSCNAGSVVCR